MNSPQIRRSVIGSIREQFSFKRIRWSWMLVGAALVGLVFVSIDGSTLVTKFVTNIGLPRSQLREVLIAFRSQNSDNGYDMRIIDGLGNVKRIFPAPGAKKEYGKMPAVSSKGDVVFTVTDREEKVVELYIHSYYREETHLLMRYTYGVSHRDDRFEEFRWSPDGTQLAYNHGKYFVVLDIDSGKDFVRIPTTPDRIAWLSNNEIALLSGGTGTRKATDLLLVDGSYVESDQDEVFFIKLSEKEGAGFEKKLICEEFIDTVFHAGIFHYKERYQEELPCIETKELSALFGSKEWPVTWIYQSNVDDRFYFYLRYKEIFEGLSKNWIEGYDRETGNTFFVYKLGGYFEDLH